MKDLQTQLVDMQDNERQGFSLIIDGIVKEINELSSAT